MAVMKGYDVGRVVLKALVFIGLLLAGGGGYLWHLSQWAVGTLDLAEQKTLYFPKGTSLEGLSGRLESLGLVDSSLSYQLWVRLFGEYHRFQAGTYQFSGSVSPYGLSKKIMAGRVYRQVAVQYTIPEGFTLKKIIDRLVAQNLGSRAVFEALLSDSTFRRNLGIRGPSFEGFIYPATYKFYKRPSPREVLSKMVETFFEKIPKDLEQKYREKGLSLREGVTFASLIELETQIESEKPMVAEVIWSRLKKKEPLGIDASLIYGIKDFDGDLTWAHLRDKKNPYNTRIHKGLPPGPIGSPALSSMLAILSPTNEGYYYYVLIGNGEKRHHFSKTLSEHNRHVKLLLKATKKKK